MIATAKGRIQHHRNDTIEEGSSKRIDDPENREELRTSSFIMDMTDQIDLSVSLSSSLMKPCERASSEAIASGRKKYPATIGPHFLRGTSYFAKINIS